MHYPKKTPGFTLIEVMISVMIFSIVMTVALGALLAMSQSDQRAEALKSVVNNLNFALDSMSRTIRTGYNYHCDTTGDLSTPGPQNCTSPSPIKTYFALRGADGNLYAYCLANGQVNRQVINSGTLDATCGSSNFSPLTSKEIQVTNLQFLVTGACPKSGAGCSGGDNIQPKVTILMSGFISVGGIASSSFNVESSITQRIYDQ